jgi:hypothetical protein
MRPDALSIPVDHGQSEMVINMPRQSEVAVIWTMARPVSGEESPPRTTVALDQEQMRALRDWLNQALGET